MTFPLQVLTRTSEDWDWTMLWKQDRYHRVWWGRTGRAELLESYWK